MGLAGDIGIFHFIGIGGIGMSGVAELLSNLGYEVQGSDVAENPNVVRMRKRGIKVFIGHKAKNVLDVRVVVVSTAVDENNIEIQEARRLKIPVIHRSEMLAELMRLKSSVAVGGSHGKTTTTSLVAAVLDEGGTDPTVINGGIINTYGTNTRLGKGDWLVAEADESDGSFLRLPAEIGIITNIDSEHMNHYHTLDNLRNSFEQFIHNIPFYGFAVVCTENQEVARLIDRIIDREVITYSFNDENSNLQAKNIRNTPDGYIYDIAIKNLDRGSSNNIVTEIKDIFLPMYGKHNILNSLAATAVGLKLGIDKRFIAQAFEKFKGVNRRFTKIGEVRGISIIDDYGHHPTEIKAVFKAAREFILDGNQVIGVVQPHRYSRVQSLFEEFSTCFEDCNTLIVSDIYPAGETEIEGINKTTLSEAIRKQGHKNVIELNDRNELAKIIKNTAFDGDMVIFLGAGTVSKWANEIIAELEKLFLREQIVSNEQIVLTRNLLDGTNG